MSLLETKRPIVPESPATSIVGQVVYVYAFDIAYEMRRYDKPELLGQPVAQFRVDPSRRSPRQLFFHRPMSVRMAPVEKLGPGGIVRFERMVKLLSVGAISVTIRLPFEVSDLAELTAYHDIRFADGRTIHDEARELAEAVRLELLPYLIRPRPGLSDEEAYTVFCVNTPDNPAFESDTFLTEHRRDIAGLLTEEADATTLADAECVESTKIALNYSKKDLIVFDWDAALVIDDPTQFDEILHIVELANLQLTELEAYDRLLDESVERAYNDLGSSRWNRWRSNRTTRDLRVLRIDLARLTDELGNISKFFGDWHTARIYQALSTRFHLGDWHRTIDDKLQTLDHIYGLLAADSTNRWMIFLEATIVFLILFDIVKAMIGAG